MYEHWHEEKEEKEELQLDLEMAMSLRETLMKRNEDLIKELVEANEKLDKFNKSSSMLDEQIQSQRMKSDLCCFSRTRFCATPTRSRGPSNFSLSNNRG